MLVVQGQNASDLKRLAYTMFNMENGALLLNGEGQNLPKPYSLFPTIDIPPETKRGLPFKVHYEPTVSIVFYIAHKGFNLKKTIEKLRAILDPLGYEHLQKYKYTMTSPGAILLQRGNVESKTVIETVQINIRKEKKEAICPARILLDSESIYIPSHIGNKAVHTWYFISAATAINLQVTSMETFNAALSSIIYDPKCIISPQKKLRSGLFAELPIHSLSPKLLRLPKLPDELAHLSSYDRQHSREAIVINGETKKITIVANDSFAAYRENPTTSFTLKWEKIPVINRNSCLLCHIPLWGKVMVIFNPRESQEAVKFEDGRLISPTFPGVYLMHNQGVAFCHYCSLRIPKCVETHLNCKLISSTVQKTQTEALKNSQLKHLLPLAQMEVTEQLPYPGAYVLDNKVIIMPPQCLKYGYLGYTPIMEKELPVLTFPAIIVES